MDKRYQVFVSSTFADLKQERTNVFQTIMQLDCIPAGMEIFPAIDEEQFNFIKKIIDDCDYYILIIGGRYGTIHEGGLSYTEKEYDYAIEKGIKVLAFIHENPDAIPLGKSEKDEAIRQKLESFRLKVTSGRLIKYWNKPEELPGLVALSLPQTIKTYPAVGWIRANSITHPEALKELNDERKENQVLKSKVEELTKQKENQSDLAGFDDEFVISGDSSFGSGRWSIALTWGDIFALISPHLLEHPHDDVAYRDLSNGVYMKIKGTGANARIDNVIYQKIKVQLKALGLINLVFSATTKGSTGLFWELTDRGEKVMIDLNSIKKEKSS